MKFNISSGTIPYISTYVKFYFVDLQFVKFVLRKFRFVHSVDFLNTTKNRMYIYKSGPLAAHRYLANGDVNRHEVSNAMRTRRVQTCPDFIYMQAHVS